MSSQNYEKVKKVVGNVVRKGSEKLSLPEQKFCAEMVFWYAEDRQLQSVPDRR